MRGNGERGYRAGETRVQVRAFDKRRDDRDGEAERDGEDRGLRQAAGAERDRVEKLVVREIDDIGAAGVEHPRGDPDLREKHAEPQRAVAVQHAPLGQHRQQRQVERHEDGDRGVDRARMKSVDSLLQPPLPRRVAGGKDEKGEYGAAPAVADRERHAQDEQNVGTVEGKPGERARQRPAVDDERESRRKDRDRDRGQLQRPQKRAHGKRALRAKQRNGWLRGDPSPVTCHRF